ncbi:hypothetical protein LguiB_018005 [Lonicera macranthoides]
MGYAGYLDYKSSHATIEPSKDREYGREGIVSTKGDVYSYGILLMETFTRKKPTDEMFSNILTMRSWVYEASLGPIAQLVRKTQIISDKKVPKSKAPGIVLLRDG